MSINRILTDKDRESYKPVIDNMFRVCPDMMSRKISEANVQQAFVLYQVISILESYINHLNILSVGCFEDTAYEYIMNTPKNNVGIITGIDTVINYDLKNYANLLNHQQTFDIIFSTSTIEHVNDDEEFLKDICSLLKMNGTGIITTDFKDDYKKGDPLPYSDKRFYTRYDLEVRLRNILKDNGCDLVEEPDYTDKDSFVYQGHQYSFATFVFRKLENV